MILAKCCHDLDILVWNLNSPVRRLSSFGSLLHYRGDTMGPEIPERCTDNCPIERDCAFSATGLYLEYRHMQQKPANPAYPNQWPFTVLSHDLSYEGRLQALQSGPYGRCVYRCDNDVVDHQVVAMELESGVSVTLIMHGHSNEEHRSMRYDGSRATLRARAGGRNEITIHHHGGKVEQIPIEESGGGHGGGDQGIMADFVRVLRGEAEPLTSARVSLESHLLAFAAEEARLQGKLIDMNEYRLRAEEITSL
jgi:hypothetical protein